MGWLLALPWVRRLGMYAAAIGAVLAALAALRRSGERLPEDSGFMRMLEDSAVMRAQGRSCAEP